MQVTFWTMELKNSRSWGEKTPKSHSSCTCTLLIGDHLLFLLQGLWWSSGRTHDFTRYGGGVLCYHLHSECHGFKHTYSHWAPVFFRDVVYLPRDEWLIFKLRALWESPEKTKKQNTLLLKRDSNHLKWSSKHDSRIHKYSVIRWMDKILHQLKKVEANSGNQLVYDFVHQQ